MSKNKPLASLSMDLDNLWSYMKTHGDAGWELFPSYLELVVPRVLNFLRQRDLRITFFIVGQDAVLEKNALALRSIAEAGHEIGNHSFHHEPWLHLYTLPQIEAELIRAEKSIHEATGQKPVGFRGPGYSLSLPILQALMQLGYDYDASTLPTYIGPFARAFYFMTAKLSPEEKKFRKMLFGGLRDGLRPLNPYRWRLDGASQGLIEVPVTTMPIFKIPFHMSYILYLSRFSARLARAYFRIATLLCRLTRTSPSLLLHPLDFLGGDEIRELSFFPAMDLSGERKIELVSQILSIYSDSFTIVPVKDHAQATAQQADLQTVEPMFQTAGELPVL